MLVKTWFSPLGVEPRRPSDSLCRLVPCETRLTPRQKLMVVLPVIAGLVIVLVYFGLFANPVVIVLIFTLYVAVSLRNRRKFRRQQDAK